jgi:hypothetical protein
MDIKEADSIRQSANAHYGDGQTIWDQSDRWNCYKRQQISRFVEAQAPQILTDSAAVLNAGSGGEPYRWLPSATINSDLYLAQVRKLPNAVVCDISLLPFADSVFDLVLCVGPVLNYAPVFESIAELSRVTKVGGHVVLHYESSRSFEHLLRAPWNRLVSAVETINGGEADRLWVYSPTLIKHLVHQHGLVIRREWKFHILASAATRIGLSQQRAAGLARLDHLFSWLNELADDRIILAEKIAPTKGATLAL